MSMRSTVYCFNYQWRRKSLFVLVFVLFAGCFKCITSDFSYTSSTFIGAFVSTDTKQRNQDVAGCFRVCMLAKAVRWQQMRDENAACTITSPKCIFFSRMSVKCKSKLPTEIILSGNWPKTLLRRETAAILGLVCVKYWATFTTHLYFSFHICTGINISSCRC